ncbi:MAG: iron-siderophore ABC transporter substrate-binding protein [Cyanobacteria bacterium J06631_9]
MASVIIFTTTACESNTRRADPTELTTQNSPTSSEQDSVATKTVSHALGQAEIPLDPQRIVVLDANGSFYVDALSSLDIQPIGVSRCSDCVALDNFEDFLEDIPTVGNNEQPSLEKIVSLNPDLILGYSWQEGSYFKLSKIAPTVMIDIFSEGNDFKRNFRSLADILDKTDKANEILADYEVRVQEFRQQMENQLKNKTASLLSFFDSTAHVYGPETLAYAPVLSDVGIQFISAYKNLGSDYLRLNLEAIPDWDADLLFLDLYYTEDSGGIESLPLFEEPIWQSLKAVQNNQAYVTDWYGGGPAMANRVIDDLYEFLLRQDS